MSTHVLPVADREVDEIIAYYERLRPGLGIEFYDELYEVLRDIERNPSHCGWLDDVHRRCSLKRFKYGVVYRESGSSIIIVAVMHLARDPDYWRGR